MHEGAVCRKIMDIVSEAAIENEINKIYEIVISVGPYSCLHEGQLNFYFDVMKKETIMEEAVIRLEPDDTLTGTSQMYVKTFRGE